MLINIDIPGNTYSVRIGESIDDFGERLREYTHKKEVYVITNKTIGPLYRDRIRASLENSSFLCRIEEIEDGEEYKSLDTASYLYDRMCDQRIERFTPVVAFGGGVIGDLAGFAASTYLRGLPFFNLPTSLIAQVDSSIGGKTGVNLKNGKNLVGTFYQPTYVHTDVELLKTLDKREYIAGLAEVVKHAVIKGEEFLSYIEENTDQILKQDPDVLEIMVTECVKIKGDVVVKDEKEAGLRRVLNLGHTLGHALEAVAGYGKMRHGQGVAIGMVAASKIAEKMGKGTSGLTKRIENLFKLFKLPVRIPREIEVEEIIEKMYIDKKVREKRLEFVLPLKPGEVVSGIDVQEKIVQETIEELIEK